MHLEFLVEDKSGSRLLAHLIPRVIGSNGRPHTYRIHSYRGIGTIPGNLRPKTDAYKGILLDNLSKILMGYAKTPGIDAIVVVLDSDRKDCRVFLDLLTDLAAKSGAPNTLFRMAIEEMEAWYLGDVEAIKTAYRNAKVNVAKSYVQDSVCGTWELLADMLHPGGRRAIEKSGWPLPGQLKVEWADAIGPHLDPSRNSSPSFAKFVAGLQRVTASASQ